MKLTTLRKLIFEKNILGFLALSSTIQRLYQVSFATSAYSNGVLSILRQQGSTLSDIMQALQLQDEQKPAMQAWLECGVKSGELRCTQGRYFLRGKLSKHLAKPKHSIAGAMLEEAVRYHSDAILHAPERMATAKPYRLADQNGTLIARSSKILEPFVEEAIDWCLQLSGQPAQVLEVGCGSGQYIAYLLQRLPNVRIHAIDYQEEVIELAASSLAACSDARQRLTLAHCDVLEMDTPGQFDWVTLHNNIYYFGHSARLPLLRHLYRQLKPGGCLLLTSSFQGGSSAIAALNLWFSLSEVGGALPELQELLLLLQQAGFVSVQARRLMPGESYFALIAQVPSPGIT